MGKYRRKIQDTPKNRSRLRGRWYGMHNRCYNINHKSHKHYRDINICDRWRRCNKCLSAKRANPRCTICKQKFENYKKDMGYPPTWDHSIDRTDNDGDYSEFNCRWATEKEQQNNRREPTTNSQPTDYSKIVIKGRGKAIYCKTVNLLFPSMLSASKYFKMSTRAIRDAIKYENLLKGKYHLEYFTEFKVTEIQEYE